MPIDAGSATPAERSRGGGGHGARVRRIEAGPAAVARAQGAARPRSVDPASAAARAPVADADSAPERPIGPFVFGPAALVRDIVLHVPGASRAMERFHIDYCCGGQKSLEAICLETRVPLDAVMGALEEEKAKGGESDAELLAIPLARLVEQIVREHHARTRDDARRLGELGRAAREAAGAEAPAIAAVCAEAERLFASLLTHLGEEESVLFPYVVELERAGAAGEPPPVALFASVRHVIADLEHEHEREEARANEVRRLAGGYASSDATPAPVRALFSALEAHEKDLQRHMHLEANVLFPRAERLEGKLRTARRR